MDLSFNTATVAELYLRQGHPSRALAIYRRIVRNDPQNHGAARRLRQLEGRRSSRRLTMDFRKTMQTLLDSTPDAVACTLMGFDGIPIDTAQGTTDGVDVQALLTELSSLAAIAKGIADHHPTGTLNNLALDGDALTAVVRPLTDEYFVAMILKPHAIAGRAAFEMRLVAQELVNELT